MKPTALLSQVKVASPCRARWEDMTGDEKIRFCRQCRKHVYNFSAMSAEEAAELIRAKEGKLCGRFYRRRDGKMLTANCPFGAKRYFRRLKGLIGTTAALLLTSIGVRGWSEGDVADQPGPFAEKCEELIWTVKGWFGLNPKVAMGSICTLPAVPAIPLMQAPGVLTNLPAANP